MKRFISLSTAVISLVLMLMCCSCSGKNLAEGFDKDNIDYCGVIDNKGIFDEDELDELNELVQETAEETELYLMIYISDTFLPEESAEVFAGDTYEEIFGEDTDGALYYMDLAEGPYAYDYISTHGKGILLYQNNIDRMLDVIYNYMPSTGETVYADEIYTAIEVICEQFAEYGNDEPGFFSYGYDSYTGNYVYYRDGKTVVSAAKPLPALVKPMFIGLIVGIIAALLTYFTTKSRYKFKSSCNPGVYVSNENTKFTQRDDHFIRTYTTKTKIESSSGGSRGGGRRSGGGSRGGGGRRR